MRELTEEERRPEVVCEWADSDVAVVRLLGEHDLASAPAVTQMMQTLARCGESVVVDLSETVFIDSTIIHRLIEADANLASRGQGFALQIGTEPVVAKVVELCGVLKRLGNAPTREEAVEIARRSAVREHPRFTRFRTRTVSPPAERVATATAAVLAKTSSSRSGNQVQ